MDEVASTIDWVNDPPKIISAGRGYFEHVSIISLLGNEAVIRKTGANLLDNQVLALTVNLGDKLVGGFETDLERMGLGSSEIAGGAGGVRSKL